MKFIYSCQHLSRNHAEMIKEFFSKDHDGRFFIVTELCRDCVTGYIANLEQGLSVEESIDALASKMTH